MGINLGKPPLGLMPEFFYERQRIQEICRAINEYVGETIQDSLLEQWSTELKERIIKYNNLNKQIIK